MKKVVSIFVPFFLFFTGVGYAEIEASRNLPVIISNRYENDLQKIYKRFSLLDAVKITYYGVATYISQLADELDAHKELTPIDLNDFKLLCFVISRKVALSSSPEKAAEILKTFDELKSVLDSFQNQLSDAQKQFPENKNYQYAARVIFEIRQELKFEHNLRKGTNTTSRFYKESFPAPSKKTAKPLISEKYL